MTYLIVTFNFSLEDVLNMELVDMKPWLDRANIYNEGIRSKLPKGIK